MSPGGADCHRGVPIATGGRGLPPVGRRSWRSMRWKQQKPRWPQATVEGTGRWPLTWRSVARLPAGSARLAAGSVVMQVCGHCGPAARACSASTPRAASRAALKAVGHRVQAAWVCSAWTFRAAMEVSGLGEPAARACSGSTLRAGSRGRGLTPEGAECHRGVPMATGGRGLPPGGRSSLRSMRVIQQKPRWPQATVEGTGRWPLTWRSVARLPA